MQRMIGQTGKGIVCFLNYPKAPVKVDLIKISGTINKNLAEKLSAIKKMNFLWRPQVILNLFCQDLLNKIL